MIAGMYPISIDTQDMCTGRDAHTWGRRKYANDAFPGYEPKGHDINGKLEDFYSSVIPPEIKCFTECLRVAGYFCSNNKKTIINLPTPVTDWGENGDNAHWKDKKGQLFLLFLTMR